MAPTSCYVAHADRSAAASPAASLLPTADIGTASQAETLMDGAAPGLAHTAAPWSNGKLGAGAAPTA